MEIIRFDDLLDNYIEESKKNMFEIYEVDVLKEWLIDIVDEDDELIDKIDSMNDSELFSLINSNYLEDIHSKIETICYEDEWTYELNLESFIYEFGGQCLDIHKKSECADNSSSYLNFYVSDQRYYDKLIFVKGNYSQCEDNIDSISSEIFNSIKDFYFDNSGNGYNYDSLSIYINEDSIELSMGFCSYIIKPINENMYNLIDAISNNINIADADKIDVLSKYIDFENFEEFIIEYLEETYDSDIDNVIQLFKNCLSFKNNEDFKAIYNDCSLYEAYNLYIDYLTMKDNDIFIELLHENNDDILMTIDSYSNYNEIVVDFLQYKISN